MLGVNGEGIRCYQSGCQERMRHVPSTAKFEGTKPRVFTSSARHIEEHLSTRPFPRNQLPNPIEDSTK